MYLVITFRIRHFGEIAQYPVQTLKAPFTLVQSVQETRLVTLPNHHKAVLKESGAEILFHFGNVPYW